MTTLAYITQIAIRSLVNNVVNSVIVNLYQTNLDNPANYATVTNIASSLQQNIDTIIRNANEDTQHTIKLTATSAK